jgi:general L-amino acid transport system substrate-binding protein
VIVFTLGGISVGAEAGDIFARVQSKGAVRCGVSEGLLGFSLKEPSGRWSGLDADFCRAVAAATLGSPEKVVFVPLITSARFLALRTGQIDLLARHTTWTFGREVGLGLHFAGTLYYDGQGFVIHNVGSAFDF